MAHKSSGQLIAPDTDSRENWRAKWDILVSKSLFLFANERFLRLRFVCERTNSEWLQLANLSSSSVARLA